jgi:uncharacterized protein (DUF885 family)
MAEGIRRGIVQPKAITIAMLPQFRQLRSASTETSIFYTPIKNLPAAFPTADKQRLTIAYRDTIERIAPALDRLVGFLERDYLPAGRSTTGWSDLPDGVAWYQAKINDRTTVSLTPDAIHRPEGGRTYRT